jgi:hypothetical protein
MAQNYKNHRRIDPLHHFLAAPLSLVTVIMAGIGIADLIDSKQYALATAAFTGPVALLIATINTRRYGLLLQDRIIAAEVNERYSRLAGEPFAPLAARLQPRQVVALRFAGDGELVALARRAAAENLAPDAIKRAITDWRADERRV